METYVYWQLTTSIENGANRKTCALSQLSKIELTERQLYYHKYQEQNSMIDAPPQILKKEPNKSSTITNIEVQQPASLLLALSAKAIYQKLTINNSSIEKLVETKNNQQK